MKIKSKLTGQRKDQIEDTMEFLYSYLRENSDEFQFKLSYPIKVIENDYVPEKRTIKSGLI